MIHTVRAQTVHCFLDAEGFLTKPLPLIENGIFRNFLYHVESACKENKNSTGHASRGYSGGISTRSHNLVWPRGELSLEQLCFTKQQMSARHPA